MIYERKTSVLDSLEFAPPHSLSTIPKRDAINLEFSDITFSIPNGRKKELKSILKGVSGSFNSGQLIAIVGPSGAGKSTLLNILTGYRTSMVSGEILVNGKKRDLKSFRKKSCYIMQEDYHLPYFSVQEMMESATTLKLGLRISRREKSIMIADIMESLSLAHCYSTSVENLSGGEKKRLSIALELINNPPVMFLDEPTSGLDSQNSYLCIKLLKKLAKEGRTIVCTIHQPSAKIFNLFDHLYAMAGGQCIYRGSIVDLIPHLSTLKLQCPSYSNPADYLLEVANGENGVDVSQLINAVNEQINVKFNFNSTELELNNESSLLLHDNNNRPATTKLVMKEDVQNSLIDSREDFDPDFTVSFWIQFYVLYKRTFLSIIRDKILTRLRLVTHIVVGLFMGILYFNTGNDAKSILSNIGSLYFSLLFLVFISMMPTITSFPLELNVFRREHLNHWYSLKAYYFAKTLADIPVQIVFSTMYILITYFMTNQPCEVDRFIYFCLICILLSLISQTTGLAIGSALTTEQAIFLGPALTVPALMFAGFFVTFSTIPFYLRWLTYLSYVRYAYEGLILSIYGMNRGTLDCSEAFCMFRYPSKILELTDMVDSSLCLDFLMLVLNFIVLRIVVYRVLRWKLNQER